jgi:hypothetical protein
MSLGFSFSNPLFVVVCFFSNTSGQYLCPSCVRRENHNPNHTRAPLRFAHSLAGGCPLVRHARTSRRHLPPPHPLLERVRRLQVGAGAVNLHPPQSPRIQMRHKAF